MQTQKAKNATKTLTVLNSRATFFNFLKKIGACQNGLNRARDIEGSPRDILKAAVAATVVYEARNRSYEARAWTATEYELASDLRWLGSVCAMIASHNVDGYRECTVAEAKKISALIEKLRA